jgi:hypothetical protein
VQTPKGEEKPKTLKEQIDSLETELSTVIEDTNQINILNGLAVQYLETMPDSGIIFANQTIEQVQLLKWEIRIADGYKNKICETFSHEDYNWTREYE